MIFFYTTFPLLQGIYIFVHSPAKCYLVQTDTPHIAQLPVRILNTLSQVNSGSPFLSSRKRRPYISMQHRVGVGRALELEMDIISHV